MPRNNIEPLSRLESVITSEKTIISEVANISDIKTATRLANNKRKEKTHRIELNTTTNVMQWENNRGGGWEHVFPNADTAKEWWSTMILSRVTENGN